MTYNEKNYIKWLHDIKPKWTEEQILHSAGKHFKKDFTDIPECTDPVIENLVFVTANYTVAELDELIELYDIDINSKSLKADKIKAINEILSKEDFEEGE